MNALYKYNIKQMQAATESHVFDKSKLRGEVALSNWKNTVLFKGISNCTLFEILLN